MLCTPPRKVLAVLLVLIFAVMVGNGNGGGSDINATLKIQNVAKARCPHVLDSAGF